MKIQEKLFHILAGIVLAMFIISVSVTAALNFRFIYKSDISRYDLERISGLSAEELMQDYDELIDYNCVWGDDSLDLPHFSLSENAAQHFREARAIFMFFGWGVIVFGIAALGLALAARRLKAGTAYLKYAAAITILLPTALGAFAVFAWDRFFVVFHEVSFGNDLWLFDPAVDPVINVLPDGFFFHEAIAIFGLVILGGIICAVICSFTNRSPE